MKPNTSSFLFTIVLDRETTSCKSFKHRCSKPFPERPKGYDRSANKAFTLSIDVRERGVKRNVCMSNPLPSRGKVYPPVAETLSNKKKNVSRSLIDEAITVSCRLLLASRPPCHTFNSYYIFRSWRRKLNTSVLPYSCLSSLLASIWDSAKWPEMGGDLVDMKQSRAKRNAKNENCSLKGTLSVVNM